MLPSSSSLTNLMAVKNDHAMALVIAPMPLIMPLKGHAYLSLPFEDRPLPRPSSLFHVVQMSYSETVIDILVELDSHPDRVPATFRHLHEEHNPVRGYYAVQLLLKLRDNAASYYSPMLVSVLVSIAGDDSIRFDSASCREYHRCVLFCLAEIGIYLFSANVTETEKHQYLELVATLCHERLLLSEGSLHGNPSGDPLVYSECREDFARLLWAYNTVYPEVLSPSHPAIELAFHIWTRRSKDDLNTMAHLITITSIAIGAVPQADASRFFQSLVFTTCTRAYMLALFHGYSPARKILQFISASIFFIVQTGENEESSRSTPSYLSARITLDCLKEMVCRVAAEFPPTRSSGTCIVTCTVHQVWLPLLRLICNPEMIQGVSFASWLETLPRRSGDMHFPRAWNVKRPWGKDASYESVADASRCTTALPSARQRIGTTDTVQHAIAPYGDSGIAV
ncbi:hypothetical protein NM688_g2860 [Phlebia brevispora]|uniref:Uncharacterized protein n=1 Tax=Phlebia brevispora TaxID=194682 RepID=A0ACC1T7H9_9APHY|nr:hypothetical protein NM688_g2860 [Phlebia brevispora]